MIDVLRYKQLSKERRIAYGKKQYHKRAKYQIEYSRRRTAEFRLVRQYRREHPEEYAERLKKALAHASIVAAEANDERMMTTIMLYEDENQDVIDSVEMIIGKREIRVQDYKIDYC